MWNLENYDYFQIFGLPFEFVLDLFVLRTRYLKLQVQYHPDKYLLGTARDQAAAQQNSKMVNQAYSVLNQPLLRAEYMLSLEGYTLSERFATELDDEFLEKVFVWQEQLSNAFVPEEVRAEVFATHSQLASALELAMAQYQYPAAFLILKKVKFIARLV